MTDTRASLATFGARLGAWIVDAIPYIAVPWLAAGLFGSPIFGIAAFLIVGVVWTILPEARLGATVGKLLAGVRVLDVDDAVPIGPRRAIVRWLVKYVVCSVLPVGYLWYFRGPYRQTWHDMAARTVVVSPIQPAAE